MKTLACIVVELEEGERVEDFISKLKRISTVNVNKKGSQLVKWKDKLKTILRKLDIPENCGGYHLLFYAVEVAAQNPRAFMKDIYSEVSKQCGEHPNVIESQIRYVIDKMVQLNKVDKRKKVLGIPADTNIKFTPSGVIKYLAITLF